MKRKIILPLSLLVLIAGGLFFLNFEQKAPASFPVNSIYSIEKGTGLNALAVDLSRQRIIKSPFWFKLFSYLSSGAREIIAGDYLLVDRAGAFRLAKRMTSGDYQLESVRITIPEGLTAKEMGPLFAEKFSKITPESFALAVAGQEGYLFPDTYLFLPTVESAEVVKKMRATFDEKIWTLEAELERFDRSLSDVIKMASIVAEEARGQEAERLVAGILWQRLAIGMPLQVDSSFKYINGKTTANLTTSDLKIDSPYNSYLYKGLPPTPISNPGLETILNTVTPTKTDYLYFLTGKEGDMHYAKNYAGHLQNKELYLK